MRDHVVRRERLHRHALFREVQHGALHVEGARHEDWMRKAVLAQDLSREAGVLARVDAPRLRQNLVLRHAEAHEHALGDLRLGPRVLVDLPAREQDWHIELALQSHGRQQAARGARAERPRAVDIRRVAVGTAAEHDDDIARRALRRLISRLEPAHRLLRDEARAEQVEGKGQREQDGRRPLLPALLPEPPRKDKERQDEDAGRQYPAGPEF